MVGSLKLGAHVSESTDSANMRTSLAMILVAKPGVAHLGSIAVGGGHSFQTN